MLERLSFVKLRLELYLREAKTHWPFPPSVHVSKVCVGGTCFPREKKLDTEISEGKKKKLLILHRLYALWLFASVTDSNSDLVGAAQSKTPELC